jgi:tRNA uridine 5-carboxymethylaminomethyl modification enzyme
MDLLALPGIGVPRLRAIWPEIAEIPPAVETQIETEARYAAYVRRQEHEVVAFRREETAELPEVDFDAIAGLSNEVREKLKLVRPRSVGQASRIEGMTPAALGLLLASARRASDGRRRA